MELNAYKEAHASHIAWNGLSEHGKWRLADPKAVPKIKNGAHVTVGSGLPYCFRSCQQCGSDRKAVHDRKAVNMLLLILSTMRECMLEKQSP